MARISPDDLGAIKKSKAEHHGDFIRVGMSTCGIAAGADKVFRVLGEEIKKRGSAILPGGDNCNLFHCNHCQRNELYLDIAKRRNRIKRNKLHYSHFRWWFYRWEHHREGS